MTAVLNTFTSFTTSNCYIVKPFNDERCFIIDLPPDLDSVLDYIKVNNLSIAGALLTHGHYDHALGLSMFDGHAYINLDDELLKSLKNKDSKISIDSKLNFILEKFQNY